MGTNNEGSGVELMSRIKISERFSKRVKCPLCLREEPFYSKVELNRIIKSHYRICCVPYDLAFEICEYVIVREGV